MDGIRTKVHRIKNVLIVEDEEDMGLILKKVLEEFGEHVVYASTYRQGMQYFCKSHDLDVVIVDLKLDGNFSGMEFIRNAKKINKEVEFIIMTAFGSDEARKEAEDLKVINFLDKPAIKLNDLLKMVDECVMRKTERRK